MIYLHGLIIHDKHSYFDYNAIMTARDVGYPKEIKVRERIPYTNHVFDFSYLAREKIFEERTLVYELSIIERGLRNRQKLNFRANEIVNWLRRSFGKTPVIDTYTPEYHFLAECSDVAVTYELGVARIKATFIASPYRIPNKPDSDLHEII